MPFELYKTLMMIRKKSNLLLGILLSTMITASFLVISQISEKTLAQSAGNMSKSASIIMNYNNKTAASGDMLMRLGHTSGINNASVSSMGNLTAAFSATK